MRQPMINGLLTPYGGMTPCRQRPSAFIRRLSRAVKGSGLLQVIARPVDGFMWGFTRQSECEALQRSAIALGGKTPSIDLALIRGFSQLRFLIISEVCLTGDTFNNSNKYACKPYAYRLVEVLSWKNTIPYQALVILAR